MLRVGILASVLAVAVAGAGWSSPDCSVVWDLLRGVSTQSSSVSLTGDGGDGPELCGDARGLDGTHVTYCAWGFALRDPAASEAMATLGRLFETCPSITATSGPVGARVNHPDSFDQSLFQVEDNAAQDIAQGAVSLSLKDKAALGRTLVFVRVTRDAPGRSE